jgi:hypothetical protein
VERAASDPLANLAAVDPRAVKYTQPQREAMAAAFEQPGVTGRDVVELAVAGLLTHPSGATLGPFTTTQSTVRALARRGRQRREREAANTRLSELPPRDATERMRCALADRIEAELDRIDIEQAQGRPVSGEVLRQLARAVREFCWIPGPDEPRPQAPGAKRNGIRQGGKTRGGLAGQILLASQEHANGAQVSPSQDATTLT